MLTWLRSLFPSEQGRLEAIFIASAAGEPMHVIKQAMAIEQRGLDGDRYASNTGFWKATDGCPVTLISTHDLAHAMRRCDIELSNGAHRRNLVISGLKTHRLEGKQFRIGEAVFSYQRPRPPCGYLDRISGRGLAKAMGKQAGICLQVIRGGRLCVGDPVVILDKGPG